MWVKDNWSWLVVTKGITWRVRGMIVVPLSFVIRYWTFTHFGRTGSPVCWMLTNIHPIRMCHLMLILATSFPGTCLTRGDGSLSQTWIPPCQCSCHKIGSVALGWRKIISVIDVGTPSDGVLLVCPEFCRQWQENSESPVSSLSKPPMLHVYEHMWCFVLRGKPGNHKSMTAGK